MFNINFRNIRLKQGLSQKQVADYLNISPQSVSKWEKGDALPSIEFLPKMAECLNCEINDFFAPIQEQSIDSNILYDFLVLMNDVICNDTKTIEDVVAFEDEHPSSIVTAINFCEDLRKRKTLDLKSLQKMLCCTEAKARLFMEQLIVGEMLEKLDIDDIYFVLEEEVFGFIIMLDFQQAHYEELYNPDADFMASFYEKIDATKKNDK